MLPWLVWLSGLSASLRTRGSLVQFPLKAHAWVSGQVPKGRCMRGSHTLIFLSLSPSLPFSLKISKILKKKKKKKEKNILNNTKRKTDLFLSNRLQGPQIKKI